MQKEHFEVVLESIESKVQQVLEYFSVLDKKIDDVRDELKYDNGILDVKISALSGRIDAVDTRLGEVEANLTKRIDAVDEKLTKRIDAVEDELTKRIDAVDEKLTKRIDAVDEKLTKRIDAVDEKLTKRIDAVHSELVAHREHVELHKAPRRRVLKQV